MTALFLFQRPGCCSFPCQIYQLTPESVELHYYSIRRGLWPMVVGLLRGVARNYFALEPSVELIRGRDDGSCDHEVFLIRFPRQVY